MSNQFQFETLQLHDGREIIRTTQSTTVSIYQNTRYPFISSVHAANHFGHKMFGDICIRMTNGTTDIFKKRMAVLVAVWR
jgi:O-acetylhomoserine/O-acetylserine sulfhydrylase-like pyridoxal-dependent enzyme